MREVYVSNSPVFERLPLTDKDKRIVKNIGVMYRLRTVYPQVVDNLLTDLLTYLFTYSFHIS